MTGLELQDLEKSESQKIKEERDYWWGCRISVFVAGAAALLVSVYFWFANIWGWAVIVSLSAIALFASVARISQMIKELENRLFWIRRLEAKDSSLDNIDLFDAFDHLSRTKYLLKDHHTEYCQIYMQRAKEAEEKLYELIDKQK